jgi:uncharacterized protein
MNFNNRPFAFQAMAKPIGPACNLNCTYCYYLEKHKIYKDTGSFRMSDILLEKFIKQYIWVQEVNTIQFVWQGGEPTLLGLDYFKKVVALQHKYADGKKIENAFQTNGTLLDDEWCAFFKKFNFLVGISIDGPRHVHDAFRLYRNGTASFDHVMRGIFLLQKHKVEFNTLTVIHRQNAKHALEIYNFLKFIGSGFLQFIPIVERTKNTDDSTTLNLVGPDDPEAYVTDWSVHPDEFGKFLVTVFNQWVKQDVGKVFVLQFDAALANWVGESPGICVFSRTCGDAVVVEHNGDVYSCDHYVYPEYKLGNINQDTLFGIVKSEKQHVFGQHKLTGLPQQCIKCKYRFTCHGECPKHRFLKTFEGEYGLNYLCSAYKMFFAHIDPYMQFMKAELKANRPPSNVMNWATRSA